jgi:NNP family nitrate/nitrite transporter-like MFS transporter
MNLLKISDEKIKTLHLSWIAFFVSFYIWFSHAPLMASIRDSFHLNDQQIKALLIINVALAIPARIVVGMLVDRFGPRIMYSLLLGISSLLCFLFAASTSYEMLALTRFLLGFAGAGFVVGIRLVGEWFPARQAGLAGGIYGGWGNFGSAAATMSLPALALLFGGDNGWRYSLTCTGMIALLYSFFFYRSVQNTPRGSTYSRPERTGAMEVTSKHDFVLYLAMNIPMYAALALLTWKLSDGNIGLLEGGIPYLIYAVLIAIYIAQSVRAYQVNKAIFKQPVAAIEPYQFRQVAVLNIAYFVTFGSELAVVSMLPLYFLMTFEQLSQVQAGILASAFAFMNLVARPGGGWLSDKFGRKKTLLVLLTGLAIGYALMSLLNSTWPIAAVALVTIVCSFFVQAGAGAVFAVA